MTNKYDGLFGLRTYPETGAPLPRRDDVSQEISNSSGQISVLVQNKINVLSKLNADVRRALQANKPLPILKNLYPLVCSTEILLLAYNSIRRNPGASTPGTQNLTVDSFSLQRVDIIQRSLKDRSFRFLDVRRK